MAVKRRSGLGKGLDSLIRDKSSLSDSSKNKNSVSNNQKSSKVKTDSEENLKRNEILDNDQNMGINTLNNGNNYDEMPINSILTKEVTINESMGERKSETVSGPENESINAPISETVSGPENESMSERKSETVSGPESESINAPISENVSGPENESINAPISETVSGPENESINAPISETVSRPANENTGEIDHTENTMEENESAFMDAHMGLSYDKKEKPVDTGKGDSVLILKISSVEPNREQPRKHFSEEGIDELASSIRQYGIIQPLLVQRRDNYYEIIAGERRWRAAMKAGLKEVPVIVKDYTSREAVEISLIENIQREDLNPIEEALAYDRLIQEFDMTQEQVAGRVSKSRSTVTNSLRLLKLDAEVRQMVIAGEISEGHARTLLGLPNEEMQKLLADRIIKDKLSVRDTEKLVKKLTTNTPKKQKTRDYQKEAILENLSEQLKVLFGTKVSITEKGRSKGKIEIEYYSDDELNRIFEMLQSISKIEY